MAGQHHPDDLATLRADLLAQRAEFAAFRARVARDRRRRHLPRRALPLLLATLLVALIPLATLAANPFTDLTGGPHDGNIDAIYNAGITTGCDPGVAYCPTANVTREEMASFLARTAGLGGNPPVANAATALQAANASTVGGYGPSGLARVARATRTSPTPLTRDAQTYLSVTVDAPAPGFVLIGGNVNFVSNARISHSAEALEFAEYAMMYADVLHAQAGAANTPAAAVATMRVLPGAWAAVPLDHVFPVGAGPQTFHARVVIYGEGDISVDHVCDASVGPTCRIAARSATLTALYVPFGPDGATP